VALALIAATGSAQAEAREDVAHRVLAI